MSRTVRVGLLGLGHMGVTHLDRLRKIEGVEIAGLCDSNRGRALAYNEKSRTDYTVYDDYEVMIGQANLDALYVCLPPFAHNGQIEMAAGAGVNIFTEKPIAIGPERGRSILNAVKESGVKSQVGYHMRFGGAVKRLRELMDEGIAGLPTLFSANYECNSLHSDWWSDIDKSGGQVLEQIIHLYDMGLYIMGDAQIVSGHIANLCHRDVPNYTVEDTSAAVIRFMSGALGTITGSNCSIPGRWVGKFRVVFENMVAEFDDYHHGRVTYTKNNNATEELVYSNDAMLDEDEYFIRVVRGEAPEFSSISEGFRGLELVSAVLASSRADGKCIVLQHT